MTQLEDAIRRARDVCGKERGAYEIEYALMSLLADLDIALPHMVDTRRLAAICPPEWEGVSLTAWPDGTYDVTSVCDPGPWPERHASAAEALDAAEREAGQ